MVKLMDSPAGGRELVSAGTHLGILYQLVDLGTQENKFSPGKYQRKLMLGFETPNETNEDGEPKTIAAFLTNSNNEKATLSQWLKAWTGARQIEAGYDLNLLLGKAALLTITHDEKADGSGTRDKIAGLSAIMDGMTVPALSRELFSFSFEPDEESKLTVLSDKMVEGIKDTPEYKNAYCPGYAPTPTLNDGIPF